MVDIFYDSYGQPYSYTAWLKRQQYKDSHPALIGNGDQELCYPLTFEEWRAAIDDKENHSMELPPEGPFDYIAPVTTGVLKIKSLTDTTFVTRTALHCAASVGSCLSEIIFGYQRLGGVTTKALVLQCGLHPNHAGRHGCTHEIHPLATRNDQHWLVEWDDVETSGSS